MGNSIIKNMGFHHVALKCKDMEKSLAMYSALGLTEVARWGEGAGEIVMMDMGNGAIIEFFANGSDEFSEKGKWEHFAVSVDNVAEAYQVALDAGFTSVSAPNAFTLPAKPAPMPIEGAFVKGPDGEVLEFFKKLG
ncbi:MAG: VOC family protein [Clostridia bacterium]|nr:VOC family protein [Clostridia bacterium]